MKLITVFITVLFILSGVILCRAEDMELKIFQIKHADARSLYNIVIDLKSEQGKISLDLNNNNLIVFDYPENLKRIAELIEALDKAEKQVTIEVLVAEVTDTFLNDAGITSSQVIIPQGKFSAILHLINTSKQVNIRSKMMVTTLSNRPATLQVSKDEIFGQEVSWYKDGRYISTPIREPVGNFLEVLPRVNPDQTITVTLRPSVSTFQQGDSPRIQKRSILTQVVINNGDTIAIGGVDSGTTQEVRHSFFGVSSGRSRQETRKVMMFLTARISD
jgi:type II secretory pathway component GspD/PulD (secretin)